MQNSELCRLNSEELVAFNPSLAEYSSTTRRAYAKFKSAILKVTSFMSPISWKGVHLVRLPLEGAGSPASTFWKEIIYRNEHWIFLKKLFCSERGLSKSGVLMKWNSYSYSYSYSVSAGPQPLFVERCLFYGRRTLTMPWLRFYGASLNLWCLMNKKKARL